MKYGVKLLELVEFPTPQILGEDASHKNINTLLENYGGKCVVKPVFLGGVGKKGKAGLIRIENNVYDVLQAKKSLFFATHHQGNHQVHANGVTFEGFIESELEVYVSIFVSTEVRSPVMLITMEGGIDVEDVPSDKKKIIHFNPSTGLKSFHINDALRTLNCPQSFISPLVQHLPKLWQLYDDFGLTMLELNPIRMQKKGGRYIPVACDIKAAFDKDNPAYKRLQFPSEIFSTDFTPFEAEINMLRTYQGQSDVVELNPKGSILPFMFGGGANSAATEVLGNNAIISSDFGGNPPYSKMKAIADITFKHWLKQCQVLLIIGGKANNTDIFVTFKAMFDSLKEHHSLNPNIHVVVGRGGPNVIKGMIYGRDILDNLSIPYRFFGHDSSMIGVLNYTLELDQWLMKPQN